MRKTLLSLASSLVAIIVTSAFGAQTPDAEALKIDCPLTLDGKLDEPFWQTAKPLGEFHVWDKTDRDRRVNDTEVRLAYDDTWLFVGVKCANPLQKLVREPKVKEHDGAVNEDESVELFFDPNGAGKVYYHFFLSCFNVKAEQRYVNGQRERTTWNLPWRSATAIDAKGWSAELAIPLYMFLEYGDLGRIQLNVARNRREPYMDASHVITHEARESSIWQPMEWTFHESESFGVLAPLMPGKLQMPFLVGLERVEVKPYFTKDGGNYYAVEVEVRGANTQSGKVELVVTDKPVSGEARVVRQAFAQAGTAVSKRTIEVPAPSPSERTINIDLKDAARGETLQTRVIENPVILKVMDAYLDRNYYTTEKEAVAVAEIALPETALKGMKLAVEHAGKILGEGTAEKETLVRFSIGELPAGLHPVRIALLREDNKPFFAIAAELVKRAPNPGREWKIDQVNRVVLNNGKPFFPFGPIMAGIKPGDEAAFKTIADAGCNTFFQWNHNVPAKDANTFLTTAAKFGLYAITLFETGWLAPRDVDLKLPQQLLPAGEARQMKALGRSGNLAMRGLLMGSAASYPDRTAVFGEYFQANITCATEAIESVKNHDNLMAYDTFDEPGNANFNITKYLDELYNLAQRVDGYHPVMVLYSSHIPKGAEWLSGGDILCTDPYWIPAMTPAAGGLETPNYVSKIVHWTDQRAAEFRKVVWIVPVGWQWSGIRGRKRILTDPEQHCQNFLAIIHGAKALFWFAYPMPSVPWENLKASMAMIKVIGPMAVQPKVRQEIAHLRSSAPKAEYKEAPFLPEKDEFPDVQGRIFRDPDGGLVLLAANSRYYPVTARFTVAGLEGKVARMFVKSSLPVEDGVFTETLEPFAVRAYRLGDALKETVQVTIASLRPAQIPPPETSWQNNMRMGKKNVFPNPSFEEETVAGLADYYNLESGFEESGQGVAKFGNKCLKLQRNQEFPVQGYVRVYFYRSPQHDKATPYVFSFWAKGGKGDEKLTVMVSDENGGKSLINAFKTENQRVRGENEFGLASEWKRYDVPLTVPRRLQGTSFDIRLPSIGTAWLDGFQLEQGDAATEFEE